MLAWLRWSERWTFNPSVVGLIPSKTRELKFLDLNYMDPQSKGTKLLLKVIKAIIIISHQRT